MATRKSQRIFIWIIAVVMTVGTLAGFVAMIIEPGNVKNDQARMEKIYADYQKAQEDYQKQVNEKVGKYTTNASEYSTQYFEELSSYMSSVQPFDKDSVKELGKNDLKQGTGDEIKDGDSFVAYYVGWTPDGQSFDGSIDGDKLKAPYLVQPGAVIQGWTLGVVGMKVGGVRELTIPSEQAYGEAGSGDKIPGNTPIKFFIMVIDKPTLPAQPQVPQELMQYGG